MTLPPGVNPVAGATEGSVGVVAKEQVTPPVVEKRSEIKFTDQLADELHKPIRKHFPKRHVWAKGIDQIWAVDLI